MLPRLTLLGKPDCHLCHEMAEVVNRVIGARASLEEKDVRSDAEWQRLYRYEIPVLLWDGQEIVRHRVDDAELRRRLQQLGFPL
jgi:hypothetical protein